MAIYLCYTWLNNQQLIPGTSLIYTRTDDGVTVQMIRERPAGFITVDANRTRFKETGMIHSAIVSCRK